MAISLLILTTTGCNVDTDSANRQVALSYNEQRVDDAAAKAGQAARNLASGAGNAISATGREIQNEVGRIDVDVNIRPDPAQNSN